MTRSLHTRVSWFLGAMLTVVAGMASGQQDPMRPAFRFGGNEASAPNAVAEPPAPAGLQSVRIDPRGARAALINGRWYAEGARVGRLRLEQVRATEVLLRDDRQRPVVMKMFPQVAVRPADRGTAERRTDATGRAGAGKREQGQ